jgi:hypothetical protein
MFERLERALALVQEEFAACRAEEQRPDDDALTEAVERCQRVVNAAHAVQAVRMAQFAAREDVRHEDGTMGQRDLPIGHVNEFASCCVGPALGLAPRSADDRVGCAAMMASRLPTTLAAMAAGDVDWFRARALVEELADVTPEVAAHVEERLFPQVLEDSAGEARRRCRRLLRRVDPDSLLQRACRSRQERELRRWQAEPGVAQWEARLPTEEAALAWAAIDELAHQLQRDHGGAPGTLGIDQARADAMLDLVLGRATVQATVTFAVPAAELVSPAGPRSPAEGLAGDLGGAGHRGASAGRLGEGAGRLADGVIEVGGAGEVPVSVLDDLARRFGTRLAFVGCDPRTGAVAMSAVDSYRPSARLAGMVQARDGTCRFPRCPNPARRCDVDHVVAYPAGETSAANLMSLCRRHHRVKQQPGWSVEMAPHGVVTWTTPVGERFTTWPVDHLGVRDTGPPPAA